MAQILIVLNLLYLLFLELERILIFIFVSYIKYFTLNLLHSRAWSKPSNIFLRALDLLSHKVSCLFSVLPPHPVRLLCCVVKLVLWQGVSRFVPPLTKVLPPNSWTLCSASESNVVKWLPRDSGDLTVLTEYWTYIQIHS